MQTSTIHLKARYYRDFPFGQPLGYAYDDLALPLDATAFLLVDVYGKGFDPDHDLGSVPELYRTNVEANRAIVVEAIRPAQDAARMANLPIIYLTNYLSPGLTAQHEWRNMSLRTVNVDVLEAWQKPNDILVHSQVIAPQPGDYLIKKQFYSGFFETHLDSLLRSLGVRTLVVVGFDSRICLGTTVTDAMYRSYRVVVLRDGVQTGEYEETRAGGWANFMAIRFIETCVGYTATAQEWIAACKAMKEQP
ncbi:MAG: cysteine hydrolase family protein [Caldilinea sp.]